MKRQLQQLIYHLWSGLWFIPGALTAGGLLSGLFFSGFLGVQVLPGRSASVFEPSLAVTLLTSLAGALITVVGVVFSITMVVLSSASSQLGPRLLSNFLNKTGTKLAIGGFVGAFSYQLLVASALSIGRKVPDLTVWIGLGGGLASFAILLGFLHMVTRFIQVPFVVDEVTQNLRVALERFQNQGSSRELSSSHLREAKDEPLTLISSTQEGFIQRVDVQGLVELARKHDTVIRLRQRAGQFVARGDALATLRGGKNLRNIDEAVQKAYSLGPERTAQQDVEFALRQLIEIATKALSPGINDPETANTVIDRVGGALAGIADKSLPSGLWHDDEQVLRLELPLTNAADLLDTAYHPLRQFGAEVESVAITLMTSFQRLTERKLHPDFAVALRAHIGWLDEAVRKQDWLPCDLACLEERRQAAVTNLDRAQD